jgi:ectoine hydroxylase-related dioxygenase (phytanoyl-CoA dioxygenase family)
MAQTVDEKDTARLQYFGIQRMQSQTDFEFHLERLALDGFTVLENILSAQECTDLSQRLDKLNEAQIQQYGRARLEQLNDFGVVRAVLAQDEKFLQLPMHPLVLQFVEHLVGSTAILHLQNAIVLEPNKRHHQAAYHRDFAKDFICDKLLALNAMFAINEFSSTTGGTWVVPGTHKQSLIPSNAYLAQHAVQIEAPAGSLFLFDGLLVHKAGDNHTDQFRRSINHLYTRPFVKQQIDLASLMRGRVEPDSRLAQLLGMWSIPPCSVEEFRVDPQHRTYRAGQG